MMIDPLSFGIGIVVSACIAVAWMQGQASMLRQCRRIARHGRSLDLVFFEDAERDGSLARLSTATGAPDHGNVSPLKKRA